MIGVDWGTSNFRAFLLGADGTIRARRQAATGVIAIADGDFAGALLHEIGDWLCGGETRVLLCGAIGSREGWREVPYVPCPARLSDIAHGVAALPFSAAELRLVPGVISHDPDGVPDTMRGEETQIFGILAELGDASLVCLPGTHSKWVQVHGGRIASVTSYMTGEVFAALRHSTLLGRTTAPGPIDWAAFDDGVAHGAGAGELLHQIFGVRALALTHRLAPIPGFAYLSGLLIGHELHAALPAAAHVHLIGDPALIGLYVRAIETMGGHAHIADFDAAAHGLAALASAIDWQAQDAPFQQEPAAAS